MSIIYDRYLLLIPVLCHLVCYEQTNCDKRRKDMETKNGETETNTHVLVSTMFLVEMMLEFRIYNSRHIYSLNKVEKINEDNKKYPKLFAIYICSFGRCIKVIVSRLD